MGIVKSVEAVTVAITDTVAETVSVNLTNSQDETNCVPFYSTRATSNIRQNFKNRQVQVFFDNDAGTPRVNVSRFDPDFIEGALSVEIFVVEFDPTKVNVQQGSWSMTGNDQTSTINAVDQSKSAVITSYAINSSVFDYEDAHCRTRFTSNTQLTHRRDSPSGNLDGRFYVLECIGTEFSTQFVQPTLGTTDLTTTATITAVDLSKSFVCGSGESLALSSLRDGATRWDFSSTTAVRLARDHGGTANAAYNADLWVVECAGTEWDAQEFDVDISASLTTNQTITSVDTARTALSHQVALCRSDPVGDLANPTNVSPQTRIQLTSATNAQLTRNSQTGANLRTSFSAIEFELSSADQTIVVGQAEETDVALAVTPSAGAVSVLVGQAEETDSALTVSPVAGAVSVSVGQANETDSAAQVFPVLEGGPQTVLINNAAEIDQAFTVTPRFPGEEKPGGFPTEIRKPKRKTRRYILPDNRVYTDPERALFELRELLKKEQRAAAQAESDGGAAPVDSMPRRLAVEGPPSDTPVEMDLTPGLIQEVVRELPRMIEARQETAVPLDPQLIYVLLQMIDDEEAALLLL